MRPSNSFCAKEEWQSKRKEQTLDRCETTSLMRSKCVCARLVIDTIWLVSEPPSVYLGTQERRFIIKKIHILSSRVATLYTLSVHGDNI